MKFMLILTLCSSLYNSCMTPIEIDKLYQSHYNCALDGYKVGGETIKSFGKQRVNDEMLYVSFVCKKIEQT